MPLDADNDHTENNIGNQSESIPNLRKISIVEKGLENHSFDSPARSRKVSAQSEHADVGPVRKKSILHHQHVNNAFEPDVTRSNHDKYTNGDIDRNKKHSTAESVYSRGSALSKASSFSRSGRHSSVNKDDRSWWYIFCLKCRTREQVPSWQPPMWSKVCPYPFCPTYRQISRIIGLSLIGILAWCILYSIVGETAAPPNGTLFQLILLTICTYVGGWLMSLTTLPPLIGMLFTGLILQNIGVVDIDDKFTDITKEFRKVALVIILTRAGLDLDPAAMKRLKFTVMKIGLLPWASEAAFVAVVSKFFLHIPWDYAALMGFTVAAVSPAVVVSCLLRLRVKGYGVAKGIPTLIIAISGIDDAASVALFGIIKSIMFSEISVTQLILQGPVSIFGGIAFGILWGIICNFVPERNDPFMVPIRILMLLVGGTVSVFGAEVIGYGGAGPLACVAAAFTCLVCWSRQGWEIEDNPAGTAFEIFWMIFEPILFGVTGAQIKFKELDGSVVILGVGILLAAFTFRILVTLVVSIRCNLNLKEKIFIAIALMSKATVQAALGPVLLGVIIDKSSPEYVYAGKVSMVCILSIMLAAPTSALLISVTGPRLLTKTKIPVATDGSRRSHRPSIRDISIIDEEEERGDIESAETASPSKNIIADDIKDSEFDRTKL